MKKLRLYLDTSVISYLDQQDAPERMAETHRLWGKIKAGEYDVFISPVVVLELNDCHESKLIVLLEQLRSIRHVILEETDEVLELASQYIDAKVLKKASFNDCQHIAYACVYNCDVVVSWNFKHLVNLKTMAGVKGVNALAGYKEMFICTPTILIEGDAEDDT